MTPSVPGDHRVVTVRQGTPDDALCIGVLGLQVFLDTYATDGIRPALAREALRGLAPEAVAAALTLPGATFIVAEAAGHMIGFAQLRAPAPHALVAEAAATELERLYVQRNFLGQGVGARLLAHAESIARANGSPTLWLTAWVGNARALHFYARHGYVEAGVTQFEFEGERHENRLFRKRVAASATDPCSGAVHDVRRSGAC